LDPDPYVFGPSGSVSARYGSSSGFGSGAGSGSGSESVPKCHGSATLILREIARSLYIIKAVFSALASILLHTRKENPSLSMSSRQKYLLWDRENAIVIERLSLKFAFPGRRKREPKAVKEYLRQNQFYYDAGTIWYNQKDHPNLRILFWGII
jgi:hypothetical protein